MATIAEILQYKWPGSEWSIEGDDYGTLNWISTDIPKPALAEIRQHNGEVQQLIAAERKAERQRDKLLDRPDTMLQIIDALCATLQKTIGALKPSAISKDIDVTRLNGLIDKINVVKNSE